MTQKFRLEMVVLLIEIKNYHLNLTEKRTMVTKEIL